MAGRACLNYQDLMAFRLNQYGLKYQDLFNEHDPDVAVAIQRMSPELKLARERRLKRAMDISFKKKYLTADQTTSLKPLEPYMTDLIDEARVLRLERDLLNGPR